MQIAEVPYELYKIFTRAAITVRVPDILATITRLKDAEVPKVAIHDLGKIYRLNHELEVAITDQKPHQAKETFQPQYMAVPLDLTRSYALLIDIEALRVIYIHCDNDKMLDHWIKPARADELQDLLERLVA
jgi:hypothetical protein